MEIGLITDLYIPQLKRIPVIEKGAVTRVGAGSLMSSLRHPENAFGATR
jgi:hypothetical protein